MSMLGKLIKAGNGGFIGKVKRTDAEVREIIMKRGQELMGAVAEVLESKNATVFEVLDLIQNLSGQAFNRLALLERTRTQEIAELKAKLEKYEPITKSESDTAEEDKK